MAEAMKDENGALRAWTEGLLARGERRWYRGEELEHIAFPLGGFGAGQVALTGRGLLDGWQLFNNFNELAHSPGAQFGIWTKTSDGKTVAKRLEKGGVADLAFAGEFPFAWVQYIDDELPVEVTLEAFSPFIPSNAKDSALPAAILRFRVRNGGAGAVDAALMASIPNLVGWDGYAPLKGQAHGHFVGNRNVPSGTAVAQMLRMEAGPGAPARFDAPCAIVVRDKDYAYGSWTLGPPTVFAHDSKFAYSMRTTVNAQIFLNVAPPAPKEGERVVYWVGDLAGHVPEELPNILEAVRGGASLVAAGGRESLFGLAQQDAEWRESMPFTWDTAAAVDSPKAEGALWEVKGLQLKPGARVVFEAASGSPCAVAGPCGRGRIVVCTGSPYDLYDPFEARRLAGRLIAFAAETEYVPQTGWTGEEPEHGTMAFAALAPADTVSVLPQWEDAAAMWDAFAAAGRFDEAAGTEGPSEPGRTWNGALSVPVSLAAGEEKHIDFVLAWHFPNRMKDDRYGLGVPPPQRDFRLGNQYNRWFGGAGEVVEYVSANLERLYADTSAFHGSFYDGTLPRWLLDGISANIATLHSGVYMWLEDGTVAGFEGTDACCPMNCTHVYNYAMAPAYLLPEVERTMRETDLLAQIHAEGFIPHRTLLPMAFPRLGNENVGPHRHALDGELGTVLKAYRDWQVCGDSNWLGTLWPNIKRVMEHVFTDHDVDGDGVIRGEQPNTYDTHAFGSNTFIGSIYLAALRATEEMARAQGDEALAQDCRRRFESGSKAYDATCWNGEYYINVFDAPGATPETYEQENCWGPGCLSDQLMGQWWAHVAGLGHVLPRERVRMALEAIYRHNWRADLSEHRHNQRVFAEGDEKGLLNCTWPNGDRLKNPLRYTDEVWTGIEYELAAAMIYEGMTLEGLQIARGARDRYTGVKRNPWCEIEYGGHYVRAMSSYGLLHAAAGLVVDRAKGALRFAPNMMQDDFKSFFAADGCWGTVAQKRAGGVQTVTVAVDHGALELRSIEIDPPAGNGDAPSISVEGPGGAVACEIARAGGMLRITPGAPVTLEEGMHLTIRAEAGP